MEVTDILFINVNHIRWNHQVDLKAKHKLKQYKNIKTYKHINININTT